MTRAVPQGRGRLAGVAGTHFEAGVTLSQKEFMEVQQMSEIPGWILT